MAAPTIIDMALTVGDRAVRPLTADEVLRMLELGILSEDEPAELLHGVLTAVTRQSVAHVAVLQRLQRWLAPLVVAGALHALAGVPELWVVDVDARRVRVVAEPRDGGYASEVPAGPEEFLRPAALDVAPLDLAQLFAGL